MMMFYYHRDLLIHSDDAFKDIKNDDVSSQDSSSELDIIDIERELRNFKEGKKLSQTDKRILNAVIERPKSIKNRLNDFYLQNSNPFSCSFSLTMKDSSKEDHSD